MTIGSAAWGEASELGIVGVAPRVRILPIRSASTIAQIDYALSFPAVRVINESLSGGLGGGTTADVAAMFASVPASGVVYVGSLGNNDGFYYGGDPSRREEVVSVAGVVPAACLCPDRCSSLANLRVAR